MASDIQAESSKNHEKSSFYIAEKGFIPRTFKSLGRIEQKIFRNKRKSIKYLPATGFFLDIKPQILSFFPRITSLNFNQKPQFRNWEDEEDIPKETILKLYGHFWKTLRCLKHLKLSTNNLCFGLLLKQIDSSPLLLSSLETFEINFDDDYDNTSQYKARSEELPQTKNLLKSLTHLI